jgi:beta propeller repeat protein
MRNKKGLYLAILISTALVLLLFLFSSSASAATSNIKITKITTSGSAQGPAISGNRIVYYDSRDGNNQIRMYNLSTSEDTLIEENEYSVYAPDIYEDTIIWCEDFHKDSNIIKDFIKYCTDSIKIILEYIVRFELWPRYPGEVKCNIWMYNLSTHQKIQLATNESNTAIPKIYGDKVVWEASCEENGTIDIYMYDLSTHRKTQITISGLAISPFIYRDKIIFLDSRNGNHLTYMYNISTATETRFPTNDSTRGACSIYEDRVVYGSNSDGRSSNIYVYNLSTQQETRITTTGFASSPAIYGDRIVWMDEQYETANWDIYVYDLSTMIETRVTTNGTAHYPVVIYGDTIVWQDMQYKRNDWQISDIYMCNLNSTL